MILYFHTFKIWSCTLLIFLGCFSVWTQSLDPYNSNYKGDFESSTDPSNYWYNSVESAITTESFDTYNGEYAMRVETSTPCTIFNRNSLPFTKLEGETYKVGFYLKGSIGKQITVSLKNSNIDADEVSVTQTIINSDWAYYKFELLSASSSEPGAAKVKIKFESSGSYILDVIHVIEFTTNDIYVNADTGSSNGNGSLISPFKTIQQGINAWTKGSFVYVMDGGGQEYKNSNFNSDPNNITNYNNNAVVNLEASDVDEADLFNPLVIRNYPNDSPVIRFDGSGGFIGKYNYLEISGFEIIGPNQDITYQNALDNRKVGANYYKGRGIAIWDGHHINIFKNTVHDCPNSGIRVNNGDYCIVSNNIVYNNTWWSPNAESAIVFATIKEFDNLSNIIKMRIVGNLVYANENRIPFYKFGDYECDGSGYGCADYNKFQDGNGVYITRNNQVNDSSGNPNPNHPDSTNTFDGYTYLANNVTYLNGINGIVVHKTDNTIVTNNTVFKNGATPVTEELPDAEPWYTNNTQGRITNSGITINNSKNVKVYNNIISTRRDDDKAFLVRGDNASAGGYVQNIDISNNIIYEGVCGNYCGNENDNRFNETNPLFNDESNYDLDILVGSPAIGTGFAHNFLPDFDFNEDLRDPSSVDIGAYVHEPHILNFEKVKQNFKNLFYPNPAKNSIYLLHQRSGNYRIYTISGILIESSSFYNHNISVNHLNSGVYLIQIDQMSIKKLVIK